MQKLPKPKQPLNPNNFLYHSMTILPFIATLVTCMLIYLHSPKVYANGSPMTYELQSWCKQTPHPHSCEFSLNSNPSYHSISKKQDFTKALVESALKYAKIAALHTQGLGSQCRNKIETGAWSDCLELYANVVHRINMTVDPNRKHNQGETQTWLSAALTSLETCTDGFKDLNGGNMLALMENNVSSMISNALAMNIGHMPLEPSVRKGFPTWVKPGVRRLLQAPTAPAADAVVAQDGSGNFKTIGAAIASAGGGGYVIYVKAGTYVEKIEVKKDNIILVGDGIGKTIITGSRSYGSGDSTFSSATLGIQGDGFIGKSLTIRNTAGPNGQQAVALRSGSDRSVFYQCSFEGYQDTLYALSNRQFYKECDIYGTIDFIFGNAAVVLQNCNIYARNPRNKVNLVTAQGRTDPNQNTGISIHNCRIAAASDLRAAGKSVKTYLGRPWKEYSRTVVLKTFLDGIIDPAGWYPWDGNFALNTLYYGEYMNTGPGSSTSNRVHWKGYHVIVSGTEAAKFTVGGLIAGGSWLPATKVPFTSVL